MRLRPWLWRRVVLVATVVSAGVFAGIPFLHHLEANRRCCQIPSTRNAVVTWKAMRGDAVAPSALGQDRWVLEAHGYALVRSWPQDDSYAAAVTAAPRATVVDRRVSP